jgi:phosphopantothenoylcysteine synthetase/decarboxylase
MHILVTAGNTQVLIDQVRCITNIFTGRTGTAIALQCAAMGHAVTFVTSHPELVDRMRPPTDLQALLVESYRTFDNLRQLLQQHVTQSRPDAIIHCAAVSDYRAEGVYAPAPGTSFDSTSSTWRATGPVPTLTDRSAGKVKSDVPELWLRLVRTPKLVDLIRSEWAFTGVLVKFKLEVGIDEESLLNIAESSRTQSGADLMVANTLEGAKSWALLGPMGGGYQRVGRDELPVRLLQAVEELYKVKSRG